MGNIETPEQHRKLFKRTLIVIVISQMFGGAGLAAGITVGALLAQEMLGTDSYAGVPVALFTLGSAVAALLVGRLSQRYSRRVGLVTGFMTGGIGAIGIVLAAISDNIVLLFSSLLVYGVGTATNLQARYAGTDLALPHQRATAISIAMVSTTFGAVAGPNLVGVMGEFALSIGVPALAGPFMLGAAAYILAGLVLFIFLRPDPLVLAKEIAAAAQQAAIRNTTEVHAHPAGIHRRSVAIGATVMVVTQLTMIAIMTMTPIHMTHNGHGMRDVGLVIGVHVGAMYLPSLITGFLVDKLGRTAIIIAAGVTLLASGLLAALAPPDSLPLLITALALLGLGWNFGLISGTALIVDGTETSTRAKTQGSVDVLVALAGASGGVVSGVVAAHFSYYTLSLVGGLLSLLLIPVVIWSSVKSNRL
ncbi:MFS transporter [Paenibacillus sp. SC116]|uniref:MFS transporter n=1 Tax=Paenibacillus sp. SC116 TaxID=2968986 RepID=UPI00215A1536|nr:MFS transporter [Paenibacillus sp. SC116]MCR8845890.1 MFS transporter [Paenibacillus sp. SC116]